MAQEREFDVVVYGASGFTGQLVAEYLARRDHGARAVRWAMAGRDAEKLARVRDAVGAPGDTPLLVADAGDAASLGALTGRAKVVLTTVGPYQLYGEPLLAGCAANGTDYVDLCGEPVWMRQMIDAYELAAKASGARIVFSCGFDSIPFDLGVLFLQEHAQAVLGAPVPRVKGRVRVMKGTFSGGTAASLKATMAAAAADPSVIALLKSPFALTPGFEGPPQPSGAKPMEDPAVGGWVAPFIMAAINTKNVHRSNLLTGHRYGTDFVYDEMVVTGPGDAGRAAAEHMAQANPLAREDGPKPGEGPSKEEREAGSYDVLFIGEAGDGRVVKAGVTGDKDPGYGSTSKMIAESAIWLAQDAGDLAGGIWTPGAAFGAAFIDRLRAKAGLTFEVEA
ncbi:MAG: saccharopine dehydrogenase NADP-binding domain-containing protein [Caulobacterales bacterium]|nr:saccharopine dehydrogenase NADP-binding domain-containing protein [Caulobacterales bacterium]